MTKSELIEKNKLLQNIIKELKDNIIDLENDLKNKIDTKKVITKKFSKTITH